METSWTGTQDLGLQFWFSPCLSVTLDSQAHGPLGNAERMNEGTLSNREIFLQQEMLWRDGRFLCRS